MDSMLSAIKAKRQGQAQSPSMEAGHDQMMVDHGSPPKEGDGLQSFVDQLDESQKAELMKLLGESKEVTPGIEKGEPSKKEKMMIESKAMEAMELAPSEDGEGEQSDDIAMSMIDRNSLQKAESGVRPRGLGDRAKMAMAENLKMRGKLK